MSRCFLGKDVEAEHTRYTTRLQKRKYGVSEKMKIRKYYVHTYLNGKMRPVKTILGMGEGE
jgi:hypothetical protein